MKKLLTILFAVALGLNLSAQTDCPPAQDANQDGVIGVDDLMDLLSHWGDTDFDFDGVYDSVDLCTDEGACNYLSNPTEACLYLDAIGACGGDCAEDTDGDGVCDVFYGPCQGESTVTYQDYTYDLVAIGDQCWFAENLKTRNYSNGDEIFTIAENTAWSDATSGASCIWLNDSVSYFQSYGRFYNYPAVVDERGLCPIGWKVPTGDDFDVASSEFGGNSISGWALKAAPPIWDGSNESGFEAVKTGYRNHNGTFVYDHAVFWTTDLHNSFYGVNRFLTTQSASLSAAAEEFTNGHSIRCIKDTE